MDDVSWKVVQSATMIGGTGNGLTVLLLPDCEGVVPFRLGKLANISKNGIRRRPGRIAGFAAPRTVESVEKPRDEEGYTQESEMWMVKGLVHWGDGRSSDNQCVALKGVKVMSATGATRP